ncbi:hypothetical protein M0R45_024728 [Rubus argutus]|uniref:Disease resistance protein At4g27190-like leucine-rich repeats domain-containing protein n=1 Tax=Rubus argutus TaxID=59490 RepID=A0AAW1WSE0_RUBAR
MQVVFPNLTILSINNCNDLKFLFSISMAKSLVELKHLEVSTCEIMEEIVSTRDQSNEETIDNIFCKLESLTLDGLPNLARFCTRGYIEFLPDTERGALLDVKSEIVVQNCLFDAQMKFPSLEKLKIYGIWELQAIWNNQFADEDSFCKLIEVVIVNCHSLMNIFVPRMMGRLNALETLLILNCDSLEVVFEVGRTDVEERHADTSAPHQLGPFYCQSLGSVTIEWCKSLQKIFPTSVARGLQKLYTLRLEKCHEVEEIIVGEAGLETTPPQFVFPKVTKVVVLDMPKLSRFYPGMHVSRWPLLTNLHVSRCNKVKLFAAKLPIFGGKQELNPLIEQSLFLIDKDSFPNLEHLILGDHEIWYGPSSPAQFMFSKLKSIEFRHCTPFSKQAALLFLHKLHNLNTLKVNGIWFSYLNRLEGPEGPEEIFVNEEEMNSGGEMGRQAVGTLTLPRVKHMKIFHLNKLLHLGNHSSQSAGPLFPNLDSLEVSWCGILKSIESSAISFRNLTTLTVVSCRGLEYLTTYSVAKSLMQLTTLRVKFCERAREIIVASNEDDHCEIAFSRLQLLELAWLPSLQGFCSGNCIVKLPFSTKLDVRGCPIELEISSQGILLSNSKSKQ